MQLKRVGQCLIDLWPQHICRGAYPPGSELNSASLTFGLRSVADCTGKRGSTDGHRKRVAQCILHLGRGSAAACLACRAWLHTQLERLLSRQTVPGMLPPKACRAQVSRY